MKPTFQQLFELHAEDQTQLEKLLHSAIAQDSNFHEALTRLAKLYCKQNQPEKVIALMEEAGTATPNPRNLPTTWPGFMWNTNPRTLMKPCALPRLPTKAYPKMLPSPRYPGLDLFQKGHANPRSMASRRGQHPSLRQPNYQRPSANRHQLTSRISIAATSLIQFFSNCQVYQ